MSKNILLIGAFGAVNLGDETIAAAVLDHYSRASCCNQFKLNIFCGDAAYLSNQLRQYVQVNIAYFNHLNNYMWAAVGENGKSISEATKGFLETANYDYKAKAILDIISTADIVHIAGGGYFKTSFPHIVATIGLIVKLARRDCFVAITGVTIGPFWNSPDLYQGNVAEIFNRANLVDIRDEVGATFLDSIGVSYGITCDDVFSYGASISAPERRDDRRIINIQTSMLFNGEHEFSMQIAEVLASSFESIYNLEKLYELRLISYASTEDDYSVCKYYRSYFSAKFPSLRIATVMGENLKIDDILLYLSLGSVNIGFRFHFLIHSMLSGRDPLCFIGNDSSARHKYLSSKSFSGYLIDVRDYDYAALTSVTRRAVINNINNNCISDATLAFINKARHEKLDVFNKILTSNVDPLTYV